MVIEQVGAIAGVFVAAAIYTEARIRASIKHQQDDDFAELMGAYTEQAKTIEEENAGVVDSDSERRSDSGVRTEDIQDGGISTKGSGKSTIEGQAGTPISGLVHAVDESDQ